MVFFFQNCNFFHFFFLVKICQIKLFAAVLHREIGFLDDKNIDQKTRKVGSFPKGLVHGFSQKCNLRHLFFLFKKRPSKVLNGVVDRQIAFVDYKNIVQKKSQNFHFSKGFSPWFFSNIVTFLIFTLYSKKTKKSV